MLQKKVYHTAPALEYSPETGPIANTVNHITYEKISRRSGGYQVKSPPYNFVEIAYQPYLGTLSQSFAQIRALTDYKPPHDTLDNVGYKSTIRNIPEVIDFFAPDFVDPIADAILQGNDQALQVMIAEGVNLNTKVLIKDNSWLLVNEYWQVHDPDYIIHYSDRFSNYKLTRLDTGLCFEINPLLLATLTKQNNMARMLLQTAPDLITDNHPLGLGYYEFLWLVNSSLIKDLVLSKAEDLCRAFFRLLKRKKEFGRESLFLNECLKTIAYEARCDLYRQFALSISQQQFKPDCCKEILQLFFANGISPDLVVNDEGKSLLHLAVTAKNAYLVMCLYDANASITLKDVNGLMPFDQAVLGENELLSGWGFRKWLQHKDARQAFPFIADDSKILHQLIKDQKYSVAMDLYAANNNLLLVRDEYGVLPLDKVQYSSQGENFLKLVKQTDPRIFIAYCQRNNIETPIFFKSKKEEQEFIAKHKPLVQEEVRASSDTTLNSSLDRSYLKLEDQSDAKPSRRKSSCRLM